MKLKDYLKEIEKFELDYLNSSKMDGYVLGLSGGIDSALAAVLTQKAVGNDRLFNIMMPIHSNPSDLEDALKLAKAFGLNYTIIDLTEAFDKVYESIKNKHELNGLAIHNIKVRLRMVTLFAIAQERRSLVIGTDNLDEHYVGYFTKYGDGAADILPLVSLLKREVYEASRMYGVIPEILNKVPSAGLFEDQTDEKEMGVTYQELDDFLIGKPIKEESKAIIDRLHRVSEHKRVPIPRPIPFERD